MKPFYKIRINTHCSALLLTALIAIAFDIQAQSGQRFKRIDYTYDLISGKVNDVLYQSGKPDAFYHIYQYDADNRIIKVVTSKDNVIWDNDARYQYYAHGPLARVELGDNQVQGIDYAYTLQGWIKGINSNLLKAENDIGNDGLPTGPNSHVAKDAYGYTLNYHAGDYQPIDVPKWNTTAHRFEALTPTSDLMDARYDLFNGNIGSMVTTIMEPKVYTGAPNEVPNILPQGTAYKYDQLNRLLEMKAVQNLDVATNSWQQGSAYTGLYHNAFRYDANGNILGQFRADGTGTTIDSLTYKYVKVVGRTKSNRLYHVNDQVTPGAFNDDIDDQGAFNNDLQTVNDGISNNYQYDEIGNLIKDKQEGIDKIEWTVYGKIKSITRLSGNLRSDLEFQYDASGNRVAKIEKPRDAGGLKPQNDWITTYYTRDAQGNVMEIYKLATVTTGTSFKVMERNVYGSSRLGNDFTEVELVGAVAPTSPFSRTLENKHYEGSNHLGNVLTVFSDRKIQRDDNGDGAVDYFQPEVSGASDYSPFGAVMEGRNLGDDGRYGFNGQEKDDEINGTANSYTAEFWEYDARLGRRWNTDPVVKVWESPFSTFSNNPVIFSDVNGDDVDPNRTKGKNFIVVANKELRKKDREHEGGGIAGFFKSAYTWDYMKAKMMSLFGKINVVEAGSASDAVGQMKGKLKGDEYVKNLIIDFHTKKFAGDKYLNEGEDCPPDDESRNTENALKSFSKEGYIGGAQTTVFLGQCWAGGAEGIARNVAEYKGEKRMEPGDLEDLTKSTSEWLDGATVIGHKAANSTLGFLFGRTFRGPIFADYARGANNKANINLYTFSYTSVVEIMERKAIQTMKISSSGFVKISWSGEIIIKPGTVKH